MKYLFLITLFFIACGGEVQDLQTLSTANTRCHNTDCTEYAELFCGAFEDCTMDIVQVNEKVSYTQCLANVEKYHFKPSTECLNCYKGLDACDLITEPNSALCPECY